MPATRTLLALLGFTPFERRSFQAFFEHAREHGPGYDFTDELWRADCAVADADDEEAMARLLNAGRLIERSVLLGAEPHAGAALQLPRPINLLLVMRALDTLVGTRPRPGARLASSSDDPPPRRVPLRLIAVPEASEPKRDSRRPDSKDRADRADRDENAEASTGVFEALSGESVATPAPQPGRSRPATTRAEPADAAVPATEPPSRQDKQVQRVLDELAFRTATLPSNVDVRALAAKGAPGARRAVEGRTDSAGTRRSRQAPLPMEHVLVIDHDAATLRLIAVQLQRFGFQIHLAGHPDDAMRLLTQRFHDYVFMDPALPGLDALLVCRVARQVPPPDDACAATVVLLADPNASAAPLQRALPAADAWLKKPIDQVSLLRLVGEREVARVAYADTARTTTII